MWFQGYEIFSRQLINTGNMFFIANIPAYDAYLAIR